MTTDVEMRHFLGKARDAARGRRDAWSLQSTGEKVAVALVLNRADWLAEFGYTLAEAIERTGPEWLALIPPSSANCAMTATCERHVIITKLIGSNTMSNREPTLSKRDHTNMDAFLGHVIAAVDIGNYAEARAWFEARQEVHA